VAGLCPDPLGELEHYHRPLAAIKGGVLLLSGRDETGWDERWKGRERGWGRRVREGEGD